MDYDESVSLDELGELDGEYKKAPFVENEDPPDGKYKVCISAAKIQKNHKGTIFLFWELTISEGKSGGRKLFKRSYIVPKSMPYTKTDLKLCGIILDDLKHLPERTSELIGVELAVFKKERSDGDGYNVYFNKRI